MRDCKLYSEILHPIIISIFFCIEFNYSCQFQCSELHKFTVPVGKTTTVFI